MKPPFTPRDLKGMEDLKSLSIISSNYFRIGNELRASALGSPTKWPSHYYVFASVIMFVAAFEAYFQEILALSRIGLEGSSSAKKDQRLVKVDSLKSQAPPYNDFKCWVKEIYRFYDPKGNGISTSSDEYTNLLALKELRNTVIHYNPIFIEHVFWPARLEQVLNRAKVEVMNASWVTNLSDPGISDWGHDTVKSAIQLFCQLSGAEDPFTTISADGLLRWE